MDDPIFIPIEQLEQNKDGHPIEFSQIIRDMKEGREGQLYIPNARKGRDKEYIPATFYYAALLNDSEYAFAFSLVDTDKVL